VGSSLTALDTTLDGFCRDLEALDNMSSRTCDTVHVFYVRAGQKTAEEILSNVVSYLAILFNCNTELFFTFTFTNSYYHLDFMSTVVSCSRLYLFIFTAIRINSVTSLPGVPSVLGLVCQCVSTSRVDWPHFHQLEGHTNHFR
jgi:hypothetical protein